MRKWWIIVMAILIFACSENRLPKGILTEKQITPVMVEINLAEAIYNQRFAQQITRENYQEDLYLSVLKKFKLDRKVFEASVLYYGKHPDKYKPVYDEVLNRLNEMNVKSRAKDSIEARKLNVKAIVKDTVQIKKTDSLNKAKDSAQAIKVNVKPIVKDSIVPKKTGIKGRGKDTVQSGKPNIKGGIKNPIKVEKLQ